MSDFLPADAASKLAKIKGESVDARDAAASASRRILDLRKSLQYEGKEPADLPHVEHEIARLQAQKERHTQIERHLAALASRLEFWLRAQPNHVSLAMARPVHAALRDGETKPIAIGRLRNEIKAAQNDLAAVKFAPLPKADLKAEAKAQIEALAKQARPRLSTDRGEFSFAFPDNQFEKGAAGRIIALLAWLDRDAMLKHLEDEIDALPEPKLALTAKEKGKRVSELTAQLDKLERQEEALIVAATAEGFDVHRRATASPAAVLGVVVRSKPKVEAA